MKQPLLIFPAVILTACTFLPLIQDTAPPPEFYPLPPSRTFPQVTPDPDPAPPLQMQPSKKAKKATSPSSAPAQSTDDSPAASNPCTGIVGEDVKDTVKMKLDCLKDNL